MAVKIGREKTRRIRCSCGSHELDAAYDESDDYPMLYVCLWSYGKGGEKWPLRFRFKAIWDILRYGHCDGDSVILDAKEAERFREFLGEFVDQTAASPSGASG